jgi:hypothetical protein
MSSSTKIMPENIEKNHIDDVRRAVRDLRISDVESLLAGKTGLALIPYADFLPGGVEPLRQMVESKSANTDKVMHFIKCLNFALRDKGLHSRLPRLRERLGATFTDRMFKAVLNYKILGKALRFDYNKKDHLPLRSIGLQIGYTGDWPKDFPSIEDLQVINLSPSEEDEFAIELFCHKAFFILAPGQKKWIAQRLPENPHPGDIWSIATLVCNRFYTSASQVQPRIFYVSKKNLLPIQEYVRKIAPQIYLKPTKICVATSYVLWPGIPSLTQAIEVESSLLIDILSDIDQSHEPQEHPRFADIVTEVNHHEMILRSLLMERISIWRTRAESISETYTDAQKKFFDANLVSLLRSVKSINNFTMSPFKDVAFGLDRMLDSALGKSVNAVNKQIGTVRIREQAGLDNYPTLFPEARQIQRKIIAHLGPTNSGKTHAAMEALMAAPHGMYLAPLRLMALEGYDRITAAGISCAMLTGEEHIKPIDATHTSATIEMCNLFNPIDVAVIDEAHLLSDFDRGWAWTQALVGVPAREIHVTGSPDALPFVNRIAQMCGDEIEVKTYTRKVPLGPINDPVLMNQIKPGDALIAFTRLEVLQLRDKLIRQGFSVATIYGALGPEIRRTEARRFREGEADVLVATDAIGLGLNLPIDRIIFTALDKFDGVSKRPLTYSEIKQIGGRAGRYGIKEKGEVGVLHPLKQARVTAALLSPPENPSDTRLIVSPPWSAVELVSKELDTEDLSEIMTYVSKELIARSPQLKAASLDNALQICSLVGNTALSLRDQYRYLGAPIVFKNFDFVQMFRVWARWHGRNQTINAPVCPYNMVPTTHDEMRDCEDILNRVTVYSWLAMRWPNNYHRIEEADQTRLKVNSLIESALARKGNKKEQKKTETLKTKFPTAMRA